MTIRVQNTAVTHEKQKQKKKIRINDNMKMKAAYLNGISMYYLAYIKLCAIAIENSRFTLSIVSIRPTVFHQYYQEYHLMQETR